MSRYNFYGREKCRNMSKDLVDNTWKYEENVIKNWEVQSRMSESSNKRWKCQKFSKKVLMSDRCQMHKNYEEVEETYVIKTVKRLG